MAHEIGLWRVDGEPTRVQAAPMPLESQLESFIEADPAILGEPILFIGRQVPTAHGKYIDLLGVDSDGDLHVFELKRDKTPRDVIAQALDYGSWIESLSHDDVLAIFESYKPDTVFEQAFSERFGISPPDELNGSHRLTVVAAEVDAASARIVEYLARFNVPINVLFFRHFADGDRSYLARTWLVDDAVASTGGQTKGVGKNATKQAWNGRDWYISFGEENGSRSWKDAQRYGFVSAGGGAWYSRTIRGVPADARVFVCLPGTGYVGVGVVTGEAQPFDEAVLSIEGTPTLLSSLELDGSYNHVGEGDDLAEYIVPVKWVRTVPRESAIWEKGFFANQNSACKLRNKFTLEELARRFELEE